MNQVNAFVDRPKSRRRDPSTTVVKGVLVAFHQAEVEAWFAFVHRG